MAYNETISLDLNPLGALPMIEVKQFDCYSRTFTFHIEKDGVEYSLADWDSAAIRIRKPDQTYIFNQVDIDKTHNTITVTFDEQCFLVPGRAYADIVGFIPMTGTETPVSKTLSTCPFIINIIASPDVMNKEMESSSEFLYLKTFIDEGAALTEQMSFLNFNVDYTDGNLYSYTALSSELEDSIDFQLNNGCLEVIFS